MVLVPYLGTVALLCAAAVGKEIAASEIFSAEQLGNYESGAIHEFIMEQKMNHWEEERSAGLMQSAQYPELGFTSCKRGIAEAIKGDANNTFKCSNTDLYHFLPHVALGGSTGEGSSSWGWTSHNGREFVAIGQRDGTAFVEINKRGQMEYLGRLPQYSVPIIWREIRAYKNYMIIGSEAVGHGIQIFDMKKLLTINKKRPVLFTQADLTGHYDKLPVGRTHNIVVNEERGYAVAVGAVPRNDSCAAGLIFIDLKDPSKPFSPGCNPDDGYVHDAQCLVYRGPDKKFKGRDICYGYNENTLTIYDVTDKTASTIISNTSYIGASYTHQGSLLDVNNQEYLLLDDELDEVNGIGPAADGFPVTYIWDIRSLEHPKQTGIYKSGTKAIDHNQYVIDGLVYQSHYGAGLRVLDVSSVPKDPTGKGICEVAFFDIYPEDDLQPGGGVTKFVGSWSSYAYFKSGYIFINTIERGAFVVKISKKQKCR